jgi:rubredoxin
MKRCKCGVRGYIHDGQAGQTQNDIAQDKWGVPRG